MSHKIVFWRSLLFTMFIFLSGLFIGFLIENSRVNTVELALYNSEINLLDQQIRDEVIGNFMVSCESGKQEIFRFADLIYEEASRLEEYDAASKFSDVLPLLHKRYDLLRLMLWTESISLNKRCPNSFHTVVYFYEYETDDSSTKGMQSFYSRMLLELKDAHEQEILLIPLAVDLDISALNVVLDSYQLESFPAVLIDERVLITEPPTFEELETYIQS